MLMGENMLENLEEKILSAKSHSMFGNEEKVGFPMQVVLFMGILSYYILGKPSNGRSIRLLWDSICKKKEC